MVLLNIYYLRRLLHQMCILFIEPLGLHPSSSMVAMAIFINLFF